MNFKLNPMVTLSGEPTLYSAGRYKITGTIAQINAAIAGLVFGSPYDVFVEAQRETRADVPVEVVKNTVFVGEAFVSGALQVVVVGKLSQHKQVLDVPKGGLHFNMRITVAVVRQEQTAVAVANKVFTIGQGQVDPFSGVVGEVAR